MPDTVPDPQTPANRNVARSTAMRSRLISTARVLFAEHGYQAVSAEEIVRGAGATRGALYHHFGGKEDLFCAVYEQIESELTTEIAQVIMDGSGTPVNGPWEALSKGARLFLSACSRPDVQRVALIDAPSVLGWERWREIGSRYGLGLIEATLTEAIAAGEIEPRPVTTLAHTLLGAIDELALLIARASDQGAARADAQATFTWLLESLRR